MKPTLISRRLLIERILFLLFGAYLSAHTLTRAWNRLNTDFPNYYLEARMAREGVDVSRSYEWTWIEREKNHRDIDQRIVGFSPLTPFSALVMLPVAGMKPLAAKHVWLVVNFGLLVATAFLLSEISSLSLLTIGILMELSFPLHFNLMYGQYYILLLFLLTAACWAAWRRSSSVAGSLVAAGIALKVFPALLVLHFLRKRNWRALLACAVVCITAAILSVAVLGWSMNRMYIVQELPWTLRGSGVDPFHIANFSLSMVLHRLFVYEPQWNPHPAIRAAWLLVVLLPLLQMFLLAPALLWTESNESGSTPERISLEWSALILIALTISTQIASYHFTVLLLPMAVMCGYLLRSRRYVLLTGVALLFFVVGYPDWSIEQVMGWPVLLHVPRLYAAAALTCISLSLLRPAKLALKLRWDRGWAAGIAALLLVSIFTGLRHQRGEYDDFAYRVPMPAPVMLAAHPIAADGGIHYIGLAFGGGMEGYQEAFVKDDQTVFAPGKASDNLSLAAREGELWVETATQTSVVHSDPQSAAPIAHAESPVLALDGHAMTFLRAVNGRKQLFLHDLRSPSEPDKQMTTPASEWNVSESTFAPDGSLVFSAAKDGGASHLYALGKGGQIEPLPVGEARYPAVSPDGRWLAFSGFKSGNWNLFLQDRSSGSTRRLSTVPCNQVESSWEADSKTLLYGSDCGRALGFTAICRRRVLP